MSPCIRILVSKETSIFKQIDKYKTIRKGNNLKFSIFYMEDKVTNFRGKYETKLRENTQISCR